MLKKLFAVSLVAGLGLFMSAAQAQGFDHRDRGFHRTAQHDGFRHGHQERHHRHHHHHNRGHR